MKKRSIIALILALALALGLASCGGGNGAASTEPSTVPSVEPSTPAPETDEPSDEPNFNPGGTSGGYEDIADVKSFIDKVAEDYDDLPAMMDFDDGIVSDTYGIDLSMLDEYAGKFPLMNVTATEFFAAKVKEGNMDAVVEAIENRVSSLEQTWATYLPEQYDLVKQYELVQEGDYVLFVVSTHAAEMAENFKAAF